MKRYCTSVHFIGTGIIIITCIQYPYLLEYKMRVFLKFVA
jgi:hypothetical protein